MGIRADPLVASRMLKKVLSRVLSENNPQRSPREGARLGALGVGGCNRLRLRLILACGLAREGARLGASGGRAGVIGNPFEHPATRGGTLYPVTQSTQFYN